MRTGLKLNDGVPSVAPHIYQGCLLQALYVRHHFAGVF